MAWTPGPAWAACRQECWGPGGGGGAPGRGSPGSCRWCTPAPHCSLTNAVYCHQSLWALANL